LFLNELKKGKSIVMILLLIMLLIIPLYNHVYYMSLYYIIVVLAFIPLTIFRIMRNDLLEKRFYDKWQKRRKKGQLFNIFGNGLRTIFSILVITFGTQFIVNGRTPSYILSELPKNVRVGLMFFLFVLGTIAGIVAWYENEKRFNKISLNLERK
jgi:Ca2+/Na+ antiporter